MDYLFCIVTALLTFISPCVLPMLPVFVTYFAGGESNKRRTFINALGFALGLIIVTVATGAIFSLIGFGLRDVVFDYKWIVNIITGCIVIILGLNFIGLIKLPFLNNTRNINVKTDNMKFISAFILGLVYALSFGACMVAFQSFSLLNAATAAMETGNIFNGIMLQVVYGVTLALLFVISAMLIDVLKGAFGFIKRHYKVINIVSGSILIVLGILMAAGVMDKISAIL